MKKIIVISLLSSILFFSCANQRTVKQEEHPVQHQPQQIFLPPPPVVAAQPTPPPILPALPSQTKHELPLNDIIFVEITPFNEGKIYTININNNPVGIYSGVSHKLQIPKNISKPIEIRIDVPDTDERYKTTIKKIEKFTNNQTIKIALFSKLSMASEKTIKLIVDMFNSAYGYYKTNDITAFRNIKVGYVYYISEAFEEFPVLDAKEKTKIIDLINKNIKLPENDVASVIQDVVNLGKNFYLKKKASNLTAEDQIKIKEEITNDFTGIWWKVFDIIKNNN